MKSTQLLTFVIAGAVSCGNLLAKETERGPRQERREELRQWHQQMQEQFRAQEAELDKLQQQINSSTGQQKVDALAAAVSALIQQRKALHSQMENFREKMQRERGGETGTAPETESSPSGSASPSGASSPGSPGSGTTPPSGQPSP